MLKLVFILLLYIPYSSGNFTQPTLPPLITFPTFPPITFVYVPFPMKLFLGLVKEGGPETFFPSERFQCKGQTTCCTCSEQCMKYRECCADYLWDTSKFLSIDVYKELLVNESRNYKIPVCKDVFPLAVKLGSSSEQNLIVDSCPEDAPFEAVKGCLNLDNIADYPHNIPVYSPDDGYFYQNEFCAQCNSIRNYILTNITAECTSGPRGTIEPFEPRLELKTDDNVTTTTTTTTTTTPPPINIRQTLGGCTYGIAKSAVYGEPRPCSIPTHPLKTSCPRGNKYYDLCNAFYGILSTHANLYCFLCAGGSRDSFPLTDCPKADDKVVSPLTWSLTISFSDKTNIGIKGPYGPGSQRAFCGGNQLYNIFTEKCEDYSCASGYIKINNKCERKIEVTETVDPIKKEEASFSRCLVNSNQAKMVIKVQEEQNITNIENYMQKVLNHSERTPFQKIFEQSGLYYFQLESTVTENMFTLISQELTNTSSILYNYTDEIFVAKYNPIVSDYYKFDPFRFHRNHRYCAEPNLLLLFQYNFTRTCDLILPFETYDYENLTQWISFNKRGIFRHASSCTNFHLQSSCKLSVIQSNYTILRNLSLLVNGKVFDTFEYLPLTNGIGVCSPANPYPIKREIRYDYDWQEKVSHAQIYIGIIGTIFSIIAYIIVAFTHLYFRELKSIHSLVISSLACSLIVSDLLYIIALFVAEEETVCKVIGILLHWSLLVVELWIVLMAFDLLSKFGSFTLSSREINLKRYCIYLIFSLGFPTIFTGIAVILNETSTYAIGYGERYVCFIANLYPRIYFYIIPLGVCILFTILSYVKAVYFLTSQELENRDVLKNSGRKDSNLIKIAFKVALSLGIIEAIGFLQISAENISESEAIFNAIFGFLYTLLRSFRGIILLWLYVLTRNKIKLLKRLLRKEDAVQSISLHATGSLATTRYTTKTSSTSLNQI